MIIIANDTEIYSYANTARCEQGFALFIDMIVQLGPQAHEWLIGYLLNDRIERTGVDQPCSEADSGSEDDVDHNEADSD